MNNMTLEAKPVIKNKFWIVENQGEKVATIQAAPDGVVLVQGTQREKFVNFKLLSAKYNIKAGKAVKNKQSIGHNIYGYPTDTAPHNELYNVRRKLPFYTKSAKSKSYFCAGYYAILINDEWSTHFCPKNITVSRYPYHGPFKTKEEANGKIQMLQANNGV